MARKSIARYASGLARFYLDCGFWRTKNFRNLDLDAIGLWACVVGACNEQGTDGRMPADPEDLAAAVGLRASRVKKPLEKLLKSGRFVRKGDEIEVVGFADHNPTSLEIDEYTEERSRQGTRGNHIRHHVNKGIYQPECVHCIEDGPPPDLRSSDRSSDPEAIATDLAKSSHGMGWDGMGTTKVVSPTGRDAPSPTDDDDGPTDLDQLANLVAQARSTRLGGGHNPAWIRAVAKGLDRQRLAQLAQGHAAAEIDRQLDGCQPTTTPPAASLHPALHTNADCPDCVDGWNEHDGTATPCATCNRVIGA